MAGDDVFSAEEAKRDGRHDHLSRLLAEDSAASTVSTASTDSHAVSENMPLTSNEQ